jgi:SAM-dependent methyltransferase
MTGDQHDRDLSAAFDAQAPRFERAPVQSDPIALKRLASEADFVPGMRILDAGCGPGLVSAALLDWGCRVVGVDLSREMIERARVRCAGFGNRAEFHQISLFEAALDALAPFDGAISRYVLHHVVDPAAFIKRQVDLIRAGGRLVLSDHLADPDPDKARHHEHLERARDRTHTANLTGGQMVDLLAASGLVNLRMVEESFMLDFDEWFDRGTPQDTKENVRATVLRGPSSRGFAPALQPDGSIRIDCWRAIASGEKRV